MITPLDIENKKFSKEPGLRKGYSVDEVNDFLDDLTADYEKIYKESNESKSKIEELEENLNHYKSIESTLNNTLVMAQSTAEEVKNIAKQQADQIISNAQSDAKQSLNEIEQEIMLKKKELDDVKKQFDVYKAKMESLLISQLEMLKEIKED